MAAPVPGVIALNKNKWLWGLLSWCLATSASAQVVSVGGMPVRVYQERQAVALAPLFDEWRALQRPPAQVQATVALRDGQAVLRLVRVPTSMALAGR